MALDDIFRVTVQWTMPETTVAQMVFHLIQSTAGTPDLDDLLDDIQIKLEADWVGIAARVSDEMTGDQISLALWDSVEEEFNTVVTKALSGDLDGTNANDVDSHQAAGLAKFFTPVAKSIGKKFFPGLSSGTFLNSIMLSAVATDLLTWAEDFAGQYASQAIDFTPGNFRRKDSTFLEWSGEVGVNLLESSQDRRRPGFGI